MSARNGIILGIAGVFLALALGFAAVASSNSQPHKPAPKVAHHVSTHDLLAANPRFQNALTKMCQDMANYNDPENIAVENWNGPDDKGNIHIHCWAFRTYNGQRFYFEYSTDKDGSGNEHSNDAGYVLKPAELKAYTQ